MAVQARLISSQSHLGDGALTLGLHLEMEDGWKTYWRTPGDSGLPPQFSWSESENLAFLRVDWPAPTRFDDPGDATIGYKHEVVLPIAVKAKNPAEPLKLRLALDYAVCEEVCVPVHADLALTIDPGTAERTVYAKQIEAFAGKVPTQVRDRANIWLSAELPGEDDYRTLHVDWRAPVELKEGAQMVVEGPRDVFFGVPERRGNSFLLPAKGQGMSTLKGQKITVTLINGDQALEQTSGVK